jgi:glutathione gamma-glutamylcysteinyltransferase
MGILPSRLFRGLWNSGRYPFSDTQKLHSAQATCEVVQESFFKRPLPENLLPFNSPEGRFLFEDAMKKKTLEPYFSLCGNYTHQADVSGCGLSSLTMVLNAFERDPNRVWKFPWRYWSDEMIPASEIEAQRFKSLGTSFIEFVGLAERHGLKAEAHYPDDYQKFLEACRLVSSSTDKHLVVSFSRPALGQTGVGHFSPVGGISLEHNRVLIMDVARFKYPAYWVDVKDLFEAMKPIDAVTGNPRGYIILSVNKSHVGNL